MGLRPRPDLHWSDLVRGPDGYLSLTKVSILASGLWATAVLAVRFFVPYETGPSDELVLGLVSIFVLRHAWAGSRWSNKDPEEPRANKKPDNPDGG